MSLQITKEESFTVLTGGDQLFIGATSDECVALYKEALAKNLHWVADNANEIVEVTLGVSYGYGDVYIDYYCDSCSMDADDPCEGDEPHETRHSIHITTRTIWQRGHVLT